MGKMRASGPGGFVVPSSNPNVPGPLVTSGLGAIQTPGGARLAGGAARGGGNVCFVTGICIAIFGLQAETPFPISTPSKHSRHTSVPAVSRQLQQSTGFRHLSCSELIVS